MHNEQSSRGPGSCSIRNILANAKVERLNINMTVFNTPLQACTAQMNGWKQETLPSDQGTAVPGIDLDHTAVRPDVRLASSTLI